MKIIQYGHLKPQYTKCTDCGAILEFTKADLTLSITHIAKGPQHDGRDYFINCPVCRHKIYDGHFLETLSGIVDEPLELDYNNHKGVVI